MIRYVISKQDPGAPNWLDTAGSPEGSLFARWTLCESYPTELEASVVTLPDLWSRLPDNGPRISPDPRADTLVELHAARAR